jgi:hypothetical protein
MCYPKGCGAFFDGGNNNISRPLAAHVATKRCRPHLQAHHNRTREVTGPYLPITMGGIRTAHLDIAAHAAEQPPPGLPHALAVNFCRVNPAFTRDHFRTSGTQSASALPGPAKTSIIMESTPLFKLGVTTRGDALRKTTWGAVHLFPTLVSGPHRPWAPSSVVKAETELRLDLWHRGDL